MVYQFAQFDPNWVTNIKNAKRPPGNRGTKKLVTYKDVVCAFDLETTRIEEIEQSVVYSWQFQVGNDITIVGRELTDFISLLKRISELLDDGVYLCIYDHNLSYEFQYLSGLYDFKASDVFAVGSRDILKCYMMDHFEFRCSQKLVGMSLDEFCKEMQVAHKKISGFDYEKKRFPWTDLDDFEMSYICNDVIGLVEAIQEKMKSAGDTLYTIPMTVTGYVRREAKEAMRKVPAYVVKTCLPDLETYQMLRESMRGGNVHANRYFAGDLVRNVHSVDRSSSYPDVLVHCDFPMGKFVEEPDVDFDRLIELINTRKKAVLMRVGIYDLSLIDSMWPMPYIPKDKCRNIVNGRFDNGRVLSADYLETTLTDVDFKIVLSEYKFSDISLIKVMHTKYGKLPEPLRNLIISYYKEKTLNKNVPGKELQYALSKVKINSCFGMMAQDPVKFGVKYNGEEFEKCADDVKKKLDAYNKKAFLCYQWGVWCAVWARYRLEESFWITGQNTIYADTDGNKYIGFCDFSEYNNARIKDCLESGAFGPDKDGNIHYMGVFEEETPAEGLLEFKTLGAKKYAYRESHGEKLKITISGVVKVDGADELESKGGVDAFSDGFVFYEAGGNEIIYNDKPNVSEYSIDGHNLKIRKNSVIRKSTYTVGITDDYATLLSESKHFIWDIEKKAIDNAIYS